jgi:hypothetical protein
MYGLQVCPRAYGGVSSAHAESSTGASAPIGRCAVSLISHDDHQPAQVPSMT